MNMIMMGGICTNNIYKIKYNTIQCYGYCSECMYIISSYDRAET
jgi:hypothetical protein